MKKVLVTGATGFVGNYVVKKLLEENYEVTATSLNETKAKNAEWFKHVTYIPFNLNELCKEKNYYSFFKQPDLLIHLAWEGLPNYKSDFHIKINLPNHCNFLENLISNGLSDISVTGTCLEYGLLQGCLNEKLFVSPSNPYGIAKYKLYEFLAGLQKNYSFNLKWIRLFYIYGEGQNPNSLFSQLDRALANKEKIFNMSGGEQVRDYLPVLKVAEYILKIAVQKKVTGIINCCSGKPVKLKDFAEGYLRQKNERIQFNLGYYSYTDYEPMRFWGDDTKLKTILDDNE